MRRPRTRTVLVVLNLVQATFAVSLWAAHFSAAQAAPMWGLPLAGTAVVDRPFEPPATQWGGGHRGVDLRATSGAAVLSAGPGTVTYAGLLAGRGVVTVTHPNGLRTTYEPVTADGPRPGATVRTGDPIGHLAGGHASCRPGTACLHWGLLRGETYLDPLSVVTLGRVQLLPFTSAPHPAGSSAVQAAVRTVATPDPVLASPGSAGARSRSTTDVLLTSAFNVSLALGVGWGVYRAARWTRRRLRRG